VFLYLEKLRYIILKEVYSKSKGSKLTPVPIDCLYGLLSDGEKARETIDMCYRYLRNINLLISQGIGPLLLLNGA
jgi:hypothetical protein